MTHTTLVRNALISTLLAASAASWAAGFPAASGEFSAADQATVATQANRTSQAAAPQGRTRAEVLAELEQARCRGDLPFDGETGRTYREVFPGRYPLPHCR